MRPVKKSFTKLSLAQGQENDALSENQTNNGQVAQLTIIPTEVPTEI